MARQPVKPVRSDVRILKDAALDGDSYVAGANQLDLHLRGVRPGRDFEFTEVDVREVNAGDTVNGTTVTIEPVIEVGNIFKLGTRYSKPLGATFLDKSGEIHDIVMGSYGIGPARIIAAAVEQRAEHRGDDGHRQHADEHAGNARQQCQRQERQHQGGGAAEDGLQDLPRAEDRRPSDSGQYGVALRYFAPHLGDTEFGLYAMNYHSRTPAFSVVRGYDTVLPGVPGIDGARGAGGYFLEYPEDIRLYGVSFQTSVGGATIAGEVSYRPNYNLQINTSDLSLTALPGAILGGFNYGAISPVYNSENVGLAPEDEIHGYRRKELWQAQVSAIHFIDRVLGASRLALLGEVGVNHIGGLESGKDGTTRYGRDPLFGQSPISPLTGGLCLAHQLDNAARWCDDDGYVTRTSWGYRIRAGLDYSNVFAGVNLSPNIAWSHDVSGNGPNFIEDAKSVSLGLNADYANRYTASISYTNFFDGKYNTLKDRDFAALSVGVSF